MSDLRKDAEEIYSAAIQACLPDKAVKKILSQIDTGSGRITVIAAGKAAWLMTAAAREVLGERIDGGVMVTKYGHSRGSIPGIEIVEAGHPIVDVNSFAGTRKAIEAVSGLGAQNTVLFLLSGGGSALFEQTELPLEELQDINRQMLACGAGIEEINTIRKHLSAVKGGRFAQLCAPARVISIMLSDVLGDHSMIASGPACPDPSTSVQALEIVKRYGLQLSERALSLLAQETPKELTGCEYYICGSVRLLCEAAEAKCRELGYETVLLTDSLTCTAREAGSMLGAIAAYHAGRGRKLAFLAGGETVVRLTGSGLGGRNQELALAAADKIAGLDGAAVFSVGSDGTDGPTDAAGGYADGQTREKLAAEGISIADVLQENDSYHALEKCGGLIITGPTGTNVNDLSAVLIPG